MRLLHDKVVLITGGSEGISAAVARAAARGGAMVTICGRRPGPARALVAELTAAGGHGHGRPGGSGRRRAGARQRGPGDRHLRPHRLPGQLSSSSHGGQPYLAPYVAAKAGLTRNTAHAHRWDRLSAAWCYMLILAGPVQVDLIFSEPHAALPAGQVSAATLPGIDDHFWDWRLWLAARQQAGNAGLAATDSRSYMTICPARSAPASRPPPSRRLWPATGPPARSGNNGRTANCPAPRRCGSRTADSASPAAAAVVRTSGSAARRDGPGDRLLHRGL